MIELFINPDEGAWGMNIKRNHQKTKWENLSTHEKNKIINCLRHTLAKGNRLVSEKRFAIPNCIP